MPENRISVSGRAERRQEQQRGHEAQAVIVARAPVARAAEAADVAVFALEG
jgi:hypothetical protein